jgi:hypothetical protein
MHGRDFAANGTGGGGMIMSNLSKKTGVFFLCALLLIPFAGYAASSSRNMAGDYENRNGWIRIKIPKAKSGQTSVDFSLLTKATRDGDICDIDGTAIQAKHGQFTFVQKNYPSGLCEFTIKILSYFEVEISAIEGDCFAYCGATGVPEGRYRRILEDHVHD